MAVVAVLVAVSVAPDARSLLPSAPDRAAAVHIPVPATDPGAPAGATDPPPPPGPAERAHRSPTSPTLEGLWSGRRPRAPAIGASVTVPGCRLATGDDAPVDGCVTWAVALPPGIDRTAWSRHETTIVAAGTTGEVVGVDLRDGALRWSTTVGSGSVRPAATTPGSAPLRLGDGSVLGLDAATGEVRWRDVGSRGRTGTVEVTSIGPATAISDGRTLRVLDWATGLVQWRRDLTAEASVLTAAGLFTVAGDRIEALDIGTGRSLWTAALGERVVPALLATGDLVVVADRGGRVHALDRASGTRRWVVDGPTAAVAAAGITSGGDGRSLVVRFYGGPATARAWHLTVLDAASGTPRLTAPLRATLDPLAATVVVGDRLVVAHTTADGGVVTARDLPDGAVRWQVPIGRPEAAAVVDGRILVTTDEALVALAPEDGRLAWRFPLPAPELVSADPLVLLVRSTLVRLDPRPAAPSSTAAG